MKTRLERKPMTLTYVEPEPYPEDQCDCQSEKRLKHGHRHRSQAPSKYERDALDRGDHDFLQKTEFLVPQHHDTAVGPPRRADSYQGSRDDEGEEGDASEDGAQREKPVYWQPEQNHSHGSGRQIGKLDYQAAGVLYLPEKARYSYLLRLPEGADIGRAINNAMDEIELDNPDLKGTLPRGYSKFSNDLLVTLLKAFSQIPGEVEVDAFEKALR